MEDINDNDNDNKNIKGVQGKNLKSDDPKDLDIHPDIDGFDWQILCKNTGLPTSLLSQAFRSYRLKCIADTVVRTRQGHIAGFTKWCTTWADNLKKQNPTSDTKSKLDTLINQFHHAQ